jgi:hypothetical protein
MVWDSVAKEITGEDMVDGLVVTNVKTGEERRLEVEAEMAEVRQMLSAQSGSAARQAALAITAEEA